MEIYRQNTNIVEFEAPEGVVDVSATASLNGGDSISLDLIAGSEQSNKKKVQLPYVSDEATVKVSWTFFVDTFNGNEEVTVSDSYDVVTPILSETEIKSIHPNATDEEVIRIEKAVRHIINAHCGQRFGRFVGTYEIRGSDSTALQLPARLLELNSVNGRDPGRWFDLDAGGWLMRYYPWGVPPVKADYFGLHQSGGVISNPNHVKMENFHRSNVYEVDGIWGWEEVPSQVREAAKLLVNDYACADNAYRDRYLTSMTAADWRIQFYSGAFQQTGNVRADQLLSDFVLRRGWVVI